MSTRSRVLVTGVTGYVGGLLAPCLLQSGYPVRVMARDPQRLLGRSWFEQVEVAKGDVLSPDSLDGALDGVDIAFYLVHSLMRGSDYGQRDLPLLEISATLQKQRVCGGSSISAAWAIRRRSCRRICVHASKRAKRSPTLVCL